MVTRLSGGLSPADGSDPRTFPQIWNVTAQEIEDLQAQAVLYGGTVVPVDGNVLTYSTAIPGWVAGTVAGGGGASVTIGTAAPGGASSGDMWWDSDNGNLYIYYTDVDSSQWVAANGPQVLVSTSAPAGYQGQLWFDSTQGKTYIYYDDGTSAQWVSAIGGSLAGNVIQVVSTTKTDTFTTSSTSFVDVTGLTATITPKFSTSKILVMAQISISGNNNLGLGHFKLAGGNTSSYVGAAAGSRVQAVFGGYTAVDTDDFLMSHVLQYLDSPATTSATTYSVQARQAFNGAVWVNRTVTDTDSVLYPRGASTITVMEIAG